MGFLMMCGLCCMCFSAWGVLQLSFMGFFYYIETPILIEDVEEHHSHDFNDFIVKTRKNYNQNALNCWATAGIYALTLVLSIICIQVSKSKSKKEEKRLADDELACVTVMPKEPQLVPALVGKSSKSSRSSPKAGKEDEKSGKSSKTDLSKSPKSGKSSKSDLTKSPKSGK